jgi:membrane-bound lytic murein transglycosylase MltF
VKERPVARARVLGSERSHGLASAWRRDDERIQLVAKIGATAERLGVDPAIGRAVAFVESNFDTDARSPDGETTGAFQLKRTTAHAMRRRLAVDGEGLPLGDEVTLGIGYLRYLDRIFAEPTVLDDAGRRTIPVADRGERRRFAIAAYNAGEGRVAEAQRKAHGAGLDARRFADVHAFLPAITQRYVARVLDAAGFPPDHGLAIHTIDGEW